MRRLVPWLLIIGILMSGCGGKDPKPPTSATPAAVGTIEGRVQDESLAPLPAVNVSILLSSHRMLTGPDGVFRFERVDAGPFRIIAAKPGYITQTRSGNLTPDGVATVAFKLEGAAVVVPYNRTLTFPGTLTCGLPQGLSCGDAAAQEDTSHRFEVEPSLAGMWVELAWTPAAAGLADKMAFEVRSATATACSGKFAEAAGASILRLKVLEGFPVSGGHLCVTVRAAPDATTVNQSYTLYVTMFYHAPPPDGFSAVP